MKEFEIGVWKKETWRPCSLADKELDTNADRPEETEDEVLKKVEKRKRRDLELEGRTEKHTFRTSAPGSSLGKW
jgi:hypothetical protein